MSQNIEHVEKFVKYAVNPKIKNEFQKKLDLHFIELESRKASEEALLAHAVRSVSRRFE